MRTPVIALRREGRRGGWATTMRENWRGSGNACVCHDIAAGIQDPAGNLRWYATFHPQAEISRCIHMIVFSTDPEGYLTKEGIRQVRGVLTFARADLLCGSGCTSTNKDTARQELQEQDPQGHGGGHQRSWSMAR